MGPRLEATTLSTTKTLWILLSASDCHIASDGSLFVDNEYESFKSYVWNGWYQEKAYEVVGVGTVKITVKLSATQSKTIRIRPVLHVPESPSNSIGTSLVLDFIKNGYSEDLPAGLPVLKTVDSSTRSVEGRINPLWPSEERNRWGKEHNTLGVVRLLWSHGDERLRECLKDRGFGKEKTLGIVPLPLSGFDIVMKGPACKRLCQTFTVTENTGVHQDNNGEKVVLKKERFVVGTIFDHIVPLGNDLLIVSRPFGDNDVLCVAYGKLEAKEIVENAHSSMLRKTRHQVEPWVSRKIKELRKTSDRRDLYLPYFLYSVEEGKGNVDGRDFYFPYVPCSVKEDKVDSEVDSEVESEVDSEVDIEVDGESFSRVHTVPLLSLDSAAGF